MGISKWLFGKIQHNNNGGHHQKMAVITINTISPHKGELWRSRICMSKPVERSIQRRAASADNADFH